MTEPNTPATPSLADELLNELMAGLIDDADEPASPTAPAADNDQDDGTALHNAMGVPHATLLAVPAVQAEHSPPNQVGATQVPSALTLTPAKVAAEVVDLADVRQRRHNARADLAIEAMYGAGEAVAVIRETFASKGADFDDAVKALPVLHRVLEHVEKIEAARNIRPALPAINIEFKGNGFFIHPANAADTARRLLDADD